MEFLLGLGLFVALLPVLLVLCIAVGYLGRPEKFTPPVRKEYTLNMP